MAVLMMSLSWTSPTWSLTNDNYVPYVCETLELECQELKPPQIVVTDLDGPLGMFLRSIPGIIFIDDDVPAVARATIAVHETTHYVDNQLGLTIGRYHPCVTEAVAWAVSNQYAIESGHSEQARWQWYLSYGCPFIKVTFP